MKALRGKRLFVPERPWSPSFSNKLWTKLYMFKKYHHDDVFVLDFLFLFFSSILVRKVL